MKRVWIAVCTAFLAASGCGSDPASPSGAGPGEAAWVRVSAGGAHTCAVDAEGLLACWGSNGSGQLGQGGGGSSATPRTVAGAGPWKEVAAGGRHTCALDLDGTVWCWGANDAGQLGDGGPRYGAPALRAAPEPVAAGGPHVAVTAGDAHACALSVVGQVVCWGASASGQAGGGGESTPALLPTVVPGGPWTHVAAGALHTCALSTEGAASCWGANGAGEVGAGAGFAGRMALSRVGGGWTFRALAAGTSVTCALDEAWRLLCWGDNTASQAAPAGPRHGSPVLRSATATSAAGAGEGWVCAAVQAGAVTCWGARWDRPGPFAAEVDAAGWEPPVAAPTALSVGPRHACAVTAEGGIVCWGSPSGGRLGPFAP